MGANGLVWPAVEAYADPGPAGGTEAAGRPRERSGLPLGYSEPDGGSDIAGAKTRAVRDGDEWVINGQKIFTTNAQNGQYAFLITRTDPTLPKHKGLTMFLVPLDTPGVEIQALPTVGDERTNITYYSDVRLSDRYRLGEVNNGWSVLHGPLDAEHSIGDEGSKLEDLSIGAGHMRFLQVGRGGRHPVGPGRPGRQRVNRWPRTRPSWPGSGAFWSRSRRPPTTPGPMGRIKGADVAIAGCRAAHRPDRPGGDPALRRRRHHRAAAPIELAHRAVQVTATYGGTTEVFRTIIAQHHLGLPRPDYPGRKAFLQQGRPAAAA